ncbi:CHAT domain-containing protein [Streptomyces sp. NPDC002566]|uniref:CHAT domain-containing protein n=1 Tax=Streptomyces sp. NPDC002566 TaxID=3364650 RepID=UPI0036C318FB
MSETLPELPPPPPDGAVQLATALSFATRIEPELIRAVRLRVLPHLDAADEADLWFCDWVAARTPHAISLLPECLPSLRASLVLQLADDPGLRRVIDVVTEFHRDLSPALFLEEQVTWLSLNGDTAAASRQLDRALHALVAENRTGLAGWFAESWPRLPQELRSTAGAWTLANASRAHAPALDPGPLPDLSLDAVRPIAQAVDRIRLGVRRTEEGGLLLGDVDGPGAVAILVPDTNPRVVEVVTDGGRRPVQIASGTVVDTEVGHGTVRLRTGAGDVYAIGPHTAEPRRDVGEGERRDDLYGLLERGQPADKLAARTLTELRDLTRHFLDTAEEHALTEAVRLAEHAVRNGYSPRRYPGLGAEAALAHHLHGAHSGTRAPLDRAIELSSQVEAVHSSDGPMRRHAATTRGAAHRERFAHTGNLSDLELALTILQLEADRKPLPWEPTPSDRTAAELLSTCLALFESDARPEHLDRALDTARRRDMYRDGMAATVTFPLARIHLARYETTQDEADRRQAERLAQSSRASEDTETQAVRAMVAMAEFRSTGERWALDAATSLLRSAVLMVSPNALPQRVSLLIDLADALRLGFRLVGSGADLDEARGLAFEAVDLAPEASVWRQAALVSLNRCLVDSGREFGRTADLDQAVEAARSAASGPHAFPHTPLAKARLADTLMRKFKMTGGAAQREAAINVLDSLINMTLGVTPSMRRACVVDLAWAIMAGPGEPRDSATDAQLALNLFDQAQPETLEGLPYTEDALLAVSTAMAVLAETDDPFTSPSLLRDTSAALADVVRSPGVPPVTRLRAALLQGRLARRFDALDDFIRSHEEVTRGIPTLMLLSGHDHDDIVREWAERTGEAAACAVETGQPGRALEFVEQRNSLLSAHSEFARTGMDRLTEAASGLAGELRWLWALLDLETGAAEPPVLLRRHDVAAQVDGLLRTLRATPGFEHLFTAMTADDMIAAASEGPIVVLNAAARRCDALIATRHGVSSLPLPEWDNVTRRAQHHRNHSAHHDPRDRAEETSHLLTWLWHTTVEPVMSTAGLITRDTDSSSSRPDHSPGTPSSRHSGTDLPRMWWCPTGPFASLPLHAAGEGTRFVPAEEAITAMDHAVHSYTPSIRALKAARSRTIRLRGVTTARVLVIVADGTRSASARMNEVRHYIPAATFLAASDATPAGVSQALSDHPCVHFIGPAAADDAPSRRTGTEPFDWLRPRLPLNLPVDGALAYLSGPDTATPRASRHGGDMSTATAFQTAGYAHVIAMLGTLDDFMAAQVAERFYLSMSDSGGGLHPERTALALHSAVRRVESIVPPPEAVLVRAAMVHLGP